MKIIKTNWISLFGVFLITFLYVFINALFHSATLAQAVFGALLSVCAYGIIFWMFFIMALILLDLLFNVRNQKNIKIKLLIEWLIISSPFIYWTVKYDEWIFLMAIATFLVAQFFREKLILKVVSK